MLKPSQILEGAKRLPMTSKQGRQFYKGSRTGSMGRHTKRGGYIIDWAKVRTFIVPNGLDTTPLKPFVTLKVRPIRSSFGPGQKHGFDGNIYYKQWKEENPEEKKENIS
ncbi:hypothetical protein PNEG_01169 [Pneumocystis murina B123]|uniref:Ribosomal protein L27 n=1 Tax=Pneumocystis murina (strain B123) TaxID=1069680 RepID=M7P9C0_PNEMU|nr:hypothetical protein PNEG_01169 [Pneumocystis murina B123]EMR10455.1 hypothetical protein PNEG_01169 [Pneumocystis murina B123]